MKNNDSNTFNVRNVGDPSASIPEEKPAISEEAKNNLADTLQGVAKFTSWDYVYYDRDSAMDIVETMIAAGWSPNER